MNLLLNSLARFVRRCMLAPAKAINMLSAGRVKPNHITLISLLGHIPVVWALWSHRPLLAGLLLAVFGIMDSLDGALARVQKSASIKGMFFDAASDRVKEVMVYVGIAGWVPIYISGQDFIHSNGYFSGYWLVTAVCGMSLVVSYIKAKGEVAASGIAKNTLNAQELNKVFADGIARYEIRMALVILGLFTGHIIGVLWILLALISFTALQRVVRISRYLKTHHV